MQKNMEGIITSSGLLLFSSAQEEEPEEKPLKVEGKDQNIIESLRMQTLSPRDAYSVIQITTKRHEQPFSIQLCFVLSLKWMLANKKFALAGVHLKACCFLRWLK